MNSKKCWIIAIGSIFLFLSSSSFAWSNYFRFINNFNFPMIITIQPEFATVRNIEGDGIQNIAVKAHSGSNQFEFMSAQKNPFGPFFNKGKIILSKALEPESYCIFSYDYQFKSLDYFTLHAENFSLLTCHGNLKTNEISLVNNQVQLLPRPLAANPLLNINKQKAAELTESLTQAECNSNNCLIASPDLNTVYLESGSTLAQSLAMQAKLNQFEPLNFEQFLGTHNSAISRQYSHSINPFDLSYSDPDNYIGITELLDAGVRQIELDIEWFNDTVTICHNHISTALQDILCTENFAASSAILEIKSWLEKNPDAFIIIYFDANLPLTGHIEKLDAILSELEPYIFTPKMANDYFHVDNNTLPAYQLSQDAILHKFKKNIIIVNDNDIDNFGMSRYIFVHVQNSKAAPLYESAIDTFFASSYADCSGNKYSTIKNLYSEDENHFNLLRFNEDSTVINYIVNAKDFTPDKYSNYFTPTNLPFMLNCPVNIFSTNMLGYTCDSSQCNNHPTDPRLYSFLWSWGLGYPLQKGSHIAYLNPKTQHFENNILQKNKIYPVLCCQLEKPSSGPTQPLTWFFRNIQVKDESDIYDAAQKECQNNGGFFAMPTTSYWLNDVLNLLNVNSDAIIVNYININQQWIPNAKYVMENDQRIWSGQALSNHPFSV